MARPTDEQIIAAGYTPEQYDRRNQLWHTLLNALPADQRKKINADPKGMDALILASEVDIKMRLWEKDNGQPMPTGPT